MVNPFGPNLGRVGAREQRDEIAATDGAVEGNAGGVTACRAGCLKQAHRVHRIAETAPKRDPATASIPPFPGRRLEAARGWLTRPTPTVGLTTPPHASSVHPTTMTRPSGDNTTLCHDELDRLSADEANSPVRRWIGSEPRLDCRDVVMRILTIPRKGPTSEPLSGATNPWPLNLSGRCCHAHSLTNLSIRQFRKSAE